MDKASWIFPFAYLGKREINILSEYLIFLQKKNLLSRYGLIIKFCYFNFVCGVRRMIPSSFSCFLSFKPIFSILDHCMVQFVKPNLLGEKREFLNRFVNPIMNGQYGDSTAHDVKVMKQRSHVLHKKLEGIVQVLHFSSFLINQKKLSK